MVLAAGHVTDWSQRRAKIYLCLEHLAVVKRPKPRSKKGQAVLQGQSRKGGLGRYWTKSGAMSKETRRNVI